MFLEKKWLELGKQLGEAKGWGMVSGPEKFADWTINHWTFWFVQRRASDTLGVFQIDT